MKLNTCICGDCLSWMTPVKDPFADLIIADPPFNINFKYDIYKDSKPVDQYLHWSHEWIDNCKRLLHADGNLLICMGDEYVSDIDVMCRHQFSLCRRNWLIWHYGFGQSGTLDHRKGFTRSKTHILRYTKHKSKFYFNAPAVAVPSARSRVYADKRADKRGKCPDDVFIFKRIAGTHIERTTMTTQMPTQLLKVWIAAMCKPEGTVFDPFAGSGSSLIAAKALSRQYLGIELSPNYTAMILSRLSQV